MCASESVPERDGGDHSRDHALLPHSVIVTMIFTDVDKNAEMLCVLCVCRCNHCAFLK